MVSLATVDKDEFARIFDEDFSLISHFFGSTIRASAWFLNNGASKHMKGTREVFERLLSGTLIYM